MPGQLGAGGGLPRSLQARHQHDRGPVGRKRQVAARLAHQAGELLVDELHDLLAGVERLEHLGAERALLHRRRELLDDLQVDVRLEQREPHLAHRLVDVVLGERALRSARPCRAFCRRSERASNIGSRLVVRQTYGGALRRGPLRRRACGPGRGPPAALPSACWNSLGMIQILLASPSAMLGQHLQVLVGQQLRVGVAAVDRAEHRLDRLRLALRLEHLGLAQVPRPSGSRSASRPPP